MEGTHEADNVSNSSADKSPDKIAEPKSGEKSGDKTGTGDKGDKNLLTPPKKKKPPSVTTSKEGKDGLKPPKDDPSVSTRKSTKKKDRSIVEPNADRMAAISEDQEMDSSASPSKSKITPIKNPASSRAKGSESGKHNFTWNPEMRGKNTKKMSEIEADVLTRVLLLM